MKTALKINLYLLLVLYLFSLSSCGKKRDESSELNRIMAKAEKMNTAEREKMAMKYREEMAETRKKVEEFRNKIKKLTLEKEVEKIPEINAELENLKNSMRQLKEKYLIYYTELKEKGGDLTDRGV